MYQKKQVEGGEKEMKKIMNFFKDEEGVTAIEYSLIAALIAVAIIATTTSLGAKIAAVFASIDGKMNPAL